MSGSDEQESTVERRPGADWEESTHERRIRALWSTVLGPDADWDKLSQVATYHTSLLRPMPFPAMPDEAYEQLEEVGRGGLGVVYRARQLTLGRIVALKAIRPREARSDDSVQAARDNFLAEALVTARLQHPNIVPVHDLLIGTDGRLQLAMKLVRGRSWADLLDDGGIDRERHLDILLQVCNAVAFAHSRGVVHNDLKPSNVMVGEFGEVVVMDWGLAVEFGDEATMDGLRHKSGVDHPCGTPAYMSPELAEGRGEDIGPWTDVYLLGGILYEILSGQAPHHHSSFLQVVIQAVDGVVPELDPALPAELRAICRRALAPEPAERFPDVLALQEALRSFQRHEESLAIAQDAGRRLGECRRRAARALDRREVSSLYEDFVQAIAGFEQAAQLWQENPAAEAGAADARAAYAAAALRQGDLALAESQLTRLDADRPDVPGLREELARAGRERDRERSSAGRLRRFVRVAALGMVALLLGGLLFAGVMNTRLQEQVERADTEAARAQRESRYNERRGEIAIAALDDLVGEVREHLIVHGTENSEKVARALLLAAKAHWLELRAADVSEERVSRSRARITYRLGTIVEIVDGDPEAALALYREGETTLRALLEAEEGLAVRRDLAANLLRQGACLLLLGQPLAALEPLAEGLQALEGHDGDPEARSLLAQLYLHRGRCHHLLADFGAAAADLRRSGELVRGTGRGEDTLIEMTVLRGAQGAPDEALQLADSALVVVRAALDEDPDNRVQQRRLARVLELRGELLRSLGELPLAREDFERAIVLRRTLLALFPSHAGERAHLAEGLADLGWIAFGQQRLSEAAEALAESVSRLRALADELPGYEAPSALARTLGRLGEVLAISGDSEQGQAHVEEALALQRELMRQHPELALERLDLADLLSLRAEILALRSASEEALDSQRRSVAEIERVLERAGSYQRARVALGRELGLLALRLADAGQPQQADVVFERAGTVLREEAAAHRAATAARVELCRLLARRARFLRGRTRLEEARAAAEQSLAVYDALSPSLRALDSNRNLRALALRELGLVLVEQGELDAAEEVLLAGHSLADELAARHPDNLELAANRVAGLAQLGMLARGRGQPEQAWEIYARCAALAEELTAADPANAAFRRTLLASFEALSLVGIELDRLDLAIEALERGAERVAADPRTRFELPFWLNRIGRLEGAAGRAEKALETLGAAEEIAREALAEDDTPRWRAHLGEALFRQSLLLISAEEDARARPKLAEARALLGSSWQLGREVVSVTLLCLSLCEQLAALDGDDEARRAACYEALDVAEGHHARSADPRSVRDLVLALLRVAEVDAADDSAGAASRLRRAIALLRPEVERIEDGPALLEHLRGRLAELEP